MDKGWRVTTCAAVALTAALSGCSGGTAASPAAGPSTEPDVLSALRTASRATQQAGSARFDGTARTGSSTSTRKGVLDWSHAPTTGRLTVTGSGAGETRCLEKAAYVRVADSVAASLGGKHWLKYGPVAPGSTDQQLTDAEPAEPLGELIASGDVRRAGTQVVREVRTTHYLGTTDTERLDLWIDGNGLLVKSVRQDNGSAGSTTTTSYYSGYGAKVTVKAPPAADTVDYTALLTAGSASPSASAS